MIKFQFEKQKDSLVAGVDEAGRGPLAGPVFAAAVIFKNYIVKDYYNEINDSKKLTEKKREDLFNKIINDENIIWSYAEVESAKIDEINVLEATKLAMLNSIKKLSEIPCHIYIDGNQPPKSQEFSMEAVIKGDSKVLSIATASIIAKHLRDKKMLVWHEKYPQYNFLKHKGYGTKAHLEAINEYGPCEIHRMSFAPLKNIRNVA